MTTVALVGGDGAGKTTVARRLENSLPWPAKYLYMGPSVVSGNAALPTTRLARALKMRAYRKAVKASDEARHAELESHDPERGTIWRLARFLNRLAEAWWRQLLSFSYRVRGNDVIYDRFFLFEAARRENSQVSRKSRLDHLEYWILDRCYPRPDLVIFMDAPPEVLYSRKAEGTLEQLAERREVVLEEGKRMPNFVMIDVSRPLEEVIAEATELIIAFRQSGTTKNRRSGSLQMQGVAGCKGKEI